MKLSKGLLFDRRYRLVNSLGQGASAQVWLAVDTMANNMKVAIKVLSSYQGIDTAGIQVFKREFTYVYNIQHQNLLTPTNYAICDGVPYLVLPYCENGSLVSMLGRADEKDVIKFLYDVSSALECLHNHGIVHQDIKPDNVLLDDDCNFLVTDFGISTQSSSEMTVMGGTQAYMGPERFEKDATPIKMNDIWALGATAYEMITGNAPFGDNGGMVQAMGERIPDLPEDLQPELRLLIVNCLESEPWNRPDAETIRKKTGRYLETGNWKEKNGRTYLYSSIAAVLAIVSLAGLWLWDYNRTKVYYFKDYAEYWGVPTGIGQLSGSEMEHRQQSYRMEYRQRKLRRLSLVNSEGNLTDHRDTESKLSRYVDVRYYYTDDGQIDYKTIYDQVGKLLYKMDYDEGLKTVTFRQNDEFGTEMNLRANTTDRLNQHRSVVEEKSRISRYLLNYDENGLLVQQLYVGLQNVPAGDQDNIYGIRFSYDSKGRKIEEQFLGIDATPTSNNIGLSITQFRYDEQDNWCEVRYLNIEGEPSHDGNNCPLVKLYSDEWGNRIRETYHQIDGTPSVRADHGVSGYSYTYDDGGHLVSITTLGPDGKPMACRFGFTMVKYDYDEHGYEAACAYYDADGHPSRTIEDGNSYSREEIKNNEKGLPVEWNFFDEEGREQKMSKGYSRMKMEYDSLGQLTQLAYYDSEDKAVLYDGLYAKYCMSYDELGHVVSMRYLDKQNKPALNDESIYEVKAEYNRQGSLVRMSFFGVDGKLAVGSGYYASMTYDYDECGNEKTIQYFDVEGKPTNNSSGVARREFYYDSKTNLLILSKDYDAKGRLLWELHSKYDQRGHVVRQYMLNGEGKLKPGTAVEHTAYDASGRAVTVWYTNLADKPINKPGSKSSKVVNKYDSRGNIIEKTFWSFDGRPSVDELGTFKREQRFNDLGLPVYERNLDDKGHPLSGRDVNPEGKCEYDNRGNLTCIECYDGYGKPRLSSDGFFRARNKYNSQNKCVETAYYGVNGQLTASRSKEYARKTTEFNAGGLELKSCYYDAKNTLFRIDQFKYNDKNRLSEQVIKNEKQQPDDRFWGYSRMIVNYNKSGLIPVRRIYYNKEGQKLGHQDYDGEKKAWGKVVGLSSTNSFNIVGDQWKRAVMEFSALCPVDDGSGAVISKITLEGEVVTCYVRLKVVDMDSLDEERLVTLRQMMKNVTVQLKKALGMPSSVSLIVIVVDKNGKRI